MEEVILTIEEHAAREGVPPSIMAAVMQFKHWAGGKKVSQTEFKDAVKDCLRAPIGGGPVCCPM